MSSNNRFVLKDFVDKFAKDIDTENALLVVIEFSYRFGLSIVVEKPKASDTYKLHSDYELFRGVLFKECDYNLRHSNRTTKIIIRFGEVVEIVETSIMKTDGNACCHSKSFSKKEIPIDLGLEGVLNSDGTITKHEDR